MKKSPREEKKRKDPAAGWLIGPATVSQLQYCLHVSNPRDSLVMAARHEKKNYRGSSDETRILVAALDSLAVAPGESPDALQRKRKLA